MAIKDFFLGRSPEDTEQLSPISGISSSPFTSLRSGNIALLSAAGEGEGMENVEGVREEWYASVEGSVFPPNLHLCHSARPSDP